MNFSSLDGASIGVAALSVIVLGFIWYGPLFGKMWIKLNGWTAKEIAAAKKKGMGLTYVGMIINTLVLVSALSLVLSALSPDSLEETFKWSAIISVGFVGTNELGSVLWEGKSPKLFLINLGYTVIAYGIAAASLKLA